MEILLVLAILAIITWLFRFFGLKYYYKIKNIEEKKFLEKNEISDDELIAILTAACESVLNKSVVVKSIKFLQNSNDSAWSRIGKLHIMQSHHLR